MKYLWPIKTGETVFDVWFVVHLCFWIFAGAQMQAMGLSLRSTCVLMFVLAAAWEVFERFAFKWWPNIWKHPESWPNYIVGDILIAGTLGVLVGYWLASKQ